MIKEVIKAANDCKIIQKNNKKNVILGGENETQARDTEREKVILCNQLWAWYYTLSHVLILYVQIY